MTDTAIMPAVEIAFRTDPGRDPDKQINEDAAAHVETKHGYLAIVCDGMGGHAGGKEAAELAVKTIREVVEGAPDVTKPRDAIKVAIEEANRRVFGMPTAETGLRPGSTVVAILAHAGGAEVAHVGDSRIYLVHAGAISQITKDHSMVQELVDRNLIRAEDAPNHPDANKIMRALGIARDVDVDVRHEPIAFVPGDTFVLCSDGLSDLVSAAEILELAGSPSPAQAAGQLVDLANARGGHDNVTAMVVRMKTSARPDAAPTLVKTVQVTQAQTETVLGGVPKDAGSGPHGTVIAGPALAPAAPAATAAPAAAPVADTLPPDRPSSLPERRPNAPLVLGLALAAIALVLAAVYAWHETQPHRVNPTIVTAVDASAPVTTATGELDAAAPEIVPAPTLTAPAGHEAGTPPLLGEPPVCARARDAAARNAPSAARLAAACKAQGGTP